MKRFLIALQFLTILPIKIASVKNRDFGKSLLYFPIVGAFIGLVLCMVAILSGFLPDIVRAAIIIITSVIITGGFHLDGFADTCDGLYGSKPKEVILDIMRDSQIGVMGVIGILSLLLLKFTLIASMPQGILLKSLILMSVFGRCSQVFACYTSNYARKEGKAKYFIEYADRREFLVASLFTLVIFLLLIRLNAIVVLILSSLPVFIFVNYAKKRIGGMTGDTIGATNEIAEAAMLFVCLF